jgi:hypothetical protein
MNKNALCAYMKLSKVEFPNLATSFDRTLLKKNGMWLGVSPRMDIKKHVLNNYWTVCSKYAQNRLGSVVNMVWRTYMIIK